MNILEAIKTLRHRYNKRDVLTVFHTLFLTTMLVQTEREWMALLFPCQAYMEDPNYCNPT